MTTPVCFTMDNLSDAADLGRGRISEPRQPGMRPALEEGFPAMLDLYEQFSVTITHFIEGWNGEAHPEEIRHLLGRGHELGMHGWQHEKWTELNDDKAYELALKSTLALEKVTGVRPKAFRAPGGGRSASTAGMLSSLGYCIDASLSVEGEDGGVVTELQQGLWTVPYQWAAVDATHWLWNDKSPEEVEHIWKDLLLEASKQGSYVCFIWHPHIMGIDPARRAVGARVLEFVHENKEFEVLSLTELIERKKSSGNN